MDHVLRPRRSMLYMPGSNARALEKGRGLPCDAIILDLEDAVAPDAKLQARAQILAALADGGYGHRELIVRTNAPDSEWGWADLEAIAPSSAHGVLLPKVEDPALVREADDRLTAAGANDAMALWCMMETPRGVLRAAEIAAASPRLAGFVLGTNDLALELHCAQTPDRQPFMTSFGLCLLAARAHGLAVIDGVYIDLDDMAGFEAACRQGRALGFDGKSLIHPKTIETANRVFGPGDEELEWARRIVTAYEKGRAAGQAVIVVDGRMIEDLHVREANRLIAMAANLDSRSG